jgi:hypothetical protein
MATLFHRSAEGQLEMAKLDPSKLPKRTQLCNDEMPQSYVSRLAWANGFQNADEFCAITSLKRNLLVKMPDEEAERIASWASAPSSELRRYAMPSGVVIPYGSATVKRTQLQTTGLRYCPACLKDGLADGRAYIRGHWHWRMIGGCPEHGCRLELDSRGITLATSFKEYACRPQPDPELSDFSADTYFIDRITKGVGGNSFLDNVPAYVAAEFCTLIGHLQYSHETRTSKDRIKDGFENATLRQKGFSIASKGRDAIWDFLSDYVEAASTRIPIPTHIYGPVLYWARINNHNPDYTLLFRFFQDHAEEFLPYEPGKTFIWPITKLKVLTVLSAAHRYGLTEERVKLVLESRYGAERVPRFFKLIDVHTTLTEAKSYVTTSDAAAAIGCSMKVCDDLIKLELLPYVPFRQYEGRVYRLIHLNDIADLVRKLEGAVDRSLDTQGLVPADEVFRYGRMRLADILGLLLEGKISRVSHIGGKVDIAGLLFDPVEIKSVVRQGEISTAGEKGFNSETIDLNAAWRRLRVKKSTMDELVEQEIIPSEEKPDRGTTRLFVKTSDVDAFEDAHIRAAELASIHDLNVAELLQRLADVAVVPVAENHIKAERFFKKIEVEAVGFM